MPRVKRPVNAVCSWMKMIFVFCSAVPGDPKYVVLFRPSLIYVEIPVSKPWIILSALRVLPRII